MEKIIETLALVLLIDLPIYIILVIAEWRILEKAGEKGWKSLIPVYNLFVSHHIVGMSHIWFILEIVFWVIELLLEIIPNIPDLLENVAGVTILIFTIVTEVIHLNKLCNCFGKKTAFKIGTFLLPEIFLPIIAFGKSTYTPPNTIL